MEQVFDFIKIAAAHVWHATQVTGRFIGKVCVYIWRATKATCRFIKRVCVAIIRFWIEYDIGAKFVRAFIILFYVVAIPVVIFAVILKFLLSIGPKSKD